MTGFLIVGSVSTKEEVIELNAIAKNAIVRERIKVLARGILNEK